MKKRILLMALAAILVGCAIGGTMAYYTNQNTATNVITSGNIRAELQEWADLDMTVPYTDPEDSLMPGEDVTKVVTVKNTGGYDAWIRVRVATTAQGDGIPTAGELPMSMDFNTTDWTEKDGWYYYNAALKPAGTTEALFTTVNFPEAMDNEWQSATFLIDITMQAVQVVHNGDSALDAAGWPIITP